ncbi:hypothetical protein C8J56DRAFT_1002944 [Mycena floridula]|nr:hypothetical protein C8J56DRAFT_1002944 [Mycena floridula]
MKPSTARETLDHLIRYLSTWSGSDKFFMVLENVLKLLVPLLHLRVRLQHRAGVGKQTTSDVAPRLTKFAGIISNSRTLWRLWGLLPIVQWMISLERNPQPTHRIQNIERLQAWAMLGYYPLEHLSYLSSQGVIPATFSLPFSNKRVNLKSSGMFSCRFWAVYVLLQFAHLREDRKLIQQRERTIRKTKGAATIAEKQELEKRWDAYWSELVANLGNLPLALHWSTEKGLIKNDIWLTIFNLVAAMISVRSGWRATALPIASDVEPQPEIVLDAVAAYEITSTEK